MIGTHGQILLLILHKKIERKRQHRKKNSHKRKPTRVTWNHAVLRIFVGNSREPRQNGDDFSFNRMTGTIALLGNGKVQ